MRHSDEEYILIETEEEQMDRYIEEQQMIQQMEARDALGIPEPYIDDLPF